MPIARTSTVRDLRNNNRSRALWELYFSAPLNRQEVGLASGFSAATVSNVLGELIAQNVVVEVGSEDSNGGRPRSLFQLNPEYGYVIGVDIGETEILVELFDLTMALRATHRSLTELPGLEPESAVTRISEAITSVIAESGVSRSAILGVGVGVPGLVVQAEDAIIYGQTIGWNAVPFGKMLREQVSLDVMIDNGARTLGQAERWFGAARTSLVSATVLMGSGVNAKISDSSLPSMQNRGGMGEWGHTTIVVGGRVCRCGATGCLEAYVGADAVVQRYDELRGDPTAARPAVGLEDRVIGILQSDGTDPVASQVVEETVTFLAAGLSSLVNLFRPDRVVIGGWFGQALSQTLLPRVQQAVSETALKLPFSQVEFRAAELGAGAVAIGAATLPMARFLDSGAAVTNLATGRRRAPRTFLADSN